MASRRSGYFPRLEAMLERNGIAMNEVVKGTGLTEKSVRRMVKNSGYSLLTSVAKVVAFLNSRNLPLDTGREFAEAEG